MAKERERQAQPAGECEGPEMALNENSDERKITPNKSRRGSVHEEHRVTN